MKSLKKTQRLAESAMMIALSVALCEIASFSFTFLQGGSVTLFGMVPLVIIAYRHGLPQGLLTAFVFSLIEMMFGLANFGYVKGLTAYILVALLDYIVAYSCFGLGGIFKGKLKSQRIELALGGALCCVIRFICHFLSGAVVWGEWTNGAKAVWIYSLTYNGTYMLAETVITVVGLLAVGSILKLDKKPKEDNK